MCTPADDIDLLQDFLPSTPLLYGTVAYAPRLLQFYTFLVSSPYMDVLAQYSIKGTRIGRGSVRGWYLEANPMAVVSDAQIQAYLKGLVKAKMISPNRNSYFPIHLGPNTTVILGGLQSCRDFCGYHRSFPISGISQTPYIYYSVIPDQSGACYGACGTSLDPFTDLTAVSAHEFAETVVNPGWGSAKYFASPLGWYNGYGGEIADICGSALDTLKDSNGTAWAVEKLWSNAHGKCITQIPPSNNTY
ncbi:hypothetical protein BC830DRAFT_1117385 [Chytriomyces sp. MP71]|nr:hypothetical protein BC830DRAFT_1117385 [Chytriomyces sp. MP71]